MCAGLCASVPSRIENSDVMTDVSVIQNKSISLHCPTSGIPRPQITWYHDDVIIANDNSSDVYIMDSGLRLFIADADTLKTGKYSCRATNEAGNAEKLFNLTVQGVCDNYSILSFYVDRFKCYQRIVLCYRSIYQNALR